jgi:exosortase
VNAVLTKEPTSEKSLAAANPAAPPRAWWVNHPGWVVVAVLGLALLWCYWTTFQVMADRWAHEPQYSHGFLVPVFAAVVLWMRRQQWVNRSWRPSPWGLLLLGTGLALHLEGAQLDIEALDGFSLLPTLAGLVLFVGGWSLLRWSWPAITFLGFMLPLPYFLEQGLSQPLRRLATLMGTYLLETLGYPAIAEGNIILIDDMPLDVANACSGLGMLMTFFALSTALVMVIRNNWVDKTIIVLSAIPIAVLVNVLRITATGVAYVNFGRDSGRFIMHDVAGYLMPPLALLLLWFELWLLDHLFQEVEESAPLAIPGLQENPRN